MAIVVFEVVINIIKKSVNEEPKPKAILFLFICVGMATQESLPIKTIIHSRVGIIPIRFWGRRLVFVKYTCSQPMMVASAAM